jgi:hypothetical protein
MLKELSEEFANKYPNLVDWHKLSMLGNLSKPFIVKYKDRLNWKFMSLYQELSEEFIYKYEDRIYFSMLFQSSYSLSASHKRRHDMVKSYSKETQNFILSKILDDIKIKFVYIKDLTPYMRKQYKKYKIFL